MKYITLIALILVAIAGSGQTRNVLESVTGTGAVTITGSSLSGMGIYTATIKNDTTRCVMLVCDTTNPEAKSIGSTGIFIGEYIGINRNTWWQFGYAVIEYGVYGVFREQYYLDANKKPLSKNIIVWVAQQIQK